MTTNAQKIQAWRNTPPYTRLTEALLKEILDTKTLCGINLDGADLRWADLWETEWREASLRGADLRWADLRWADFRRADLNGANLRGADLYGVELTTANLTDAQLYMADLREADLCDGITFTGLPSGDGYFLPTPHGWRITIGCWDHKTLSDLRALINDEAEWPEAEGRERERRRPILAGLLAMCEAHEAAHPGIVYELAKIHGTEEEQ
ncbi:pentapeptide repeat-containing protein [Dermabacter hominis]|uniref:pentapeptide repeat-containing protein n=1 Tax=Dermabacter hominis TaxID=36740 RepID=UPI0021A27956|nr:pentapeptide repeat-containing protein [Dermabacter hominis]MCT2056933.1 pentapeptide repeat-containing protein [Dermabacter hominis]MCT2084408.1 pentapeptide repeat-containing protein [Dermabacter hominis]MCT2091761.1 pentapeptide repeat-containing protein [Dermabacter hominis]MCT2190804.1 pentapeptide repeat-containing protein [Dermabacter hominis]MCT2227957.1 pentapeptide repeat-containing protein [Dermabacter hominis]